MEIVFPHEIEFKLTARPSVGEVAQSLIANAELVATVGRVLQQCIPDIQIEKITVELLSATTSSPSKEALAAGILLTFQEDLRREVPKLIEGITGVYIDPGYTTLVTVIFLVVVIYGIEKAWELFKKPKLETAAPYPPPQITQNVGTIIHAGAALVGLAPGQFAAALDRSFAPHQRRALAKTAVKFIQPAKQDAGAWITGGGLMITPETIAEAPSTLDIALEDEDDEKTEGYRKVRIILHAYDIDHVSSGWAGHIDGPWNKRLRIKLSPSIQPSTLFGKESIVADIILVSKRREDGTYVPSLIHLIDTYA
jgi:hypothetical protein